MHDSLVAELSDSLEKIMLLPFLVWRHSIQLSPEGEMNSGAYIPRREVSRYISTALHQP